MDRAACGTVPAVTVIYRFCCLKTEFPLAIHLMVTLACMLHFRFLLTAVTVLRTQEMHEAGNAVLRVT